MKILLGIVGIILILCLPALLFADLAGVVQIPPGQKSDYYTGVTSMALFGLFIFSLAAAEIVEAKSKKKEIPSESSAPKE